MENAHADLPAIAAEFDQVLDKIRRQSGFGTFLRPPPVGELAMAAAEGPVVLVNVSDLRSDALILTPDGVGVVPLPGLRPTSLAEQVDAFHQALDAVIGRAPGRDPAIEADHEQQLAHILGWLWDTVTGPVLDCLDRTASSSEGTASPRVWWCPAGLLAFLPLHAAGHHQTRFDPSPATVTDWVVSSVIPTVRALLHARRTETISPVAGRVLAVAMPRTPGHPDLPGVEAECRILTNLLPGRVTVLGLPDGPAATRDAVLSALPHHQWVHLSCHAQSDTTDPSASHLLLQDHQTRPLTVLDLTHAHLEHADLAYLSACTTARTGNDLPNEPIHLAAACQLAGFRDIVATLWPIDDRDAVRVARTVYTSVMTATEPNPDTEAASRTATAVHTATRRLRALHLNRPSRWAASVHIGR